MMSKYKERKGTLFADKFKTVWSSFNGSATTVTITLPRKQAKILRKTFYAHNTPAKILELKADEMTVRANIPDMLLNIIENDVRSKYSVTIFDSLGSEE